MFVNFVSGGQVGDLIHTMFVVKNICNVYNLKANIFISDGSYRINRSGNFTFDLPKTFNDLYFLIKNQSYVNNFSILPRDFKDPYINLNDWRDHIEYTKVNGVFSKCWTDILTDAYNLKLDNSDYTKWLDVDDDTFTIGKTLIHRSLHRHNRDFDWNKYLDYIDGDILFITSNEKEWDIFPYKRDNIKLYLRNTIFDMAKSIKSCKYFIGNQSSPFSIACALDVERLVELDYGSQNFYINERNYFNKISWYYNDDCKHIGNNPYNINI